MLRSRDAHIYSIALLYETSWASPYHRNEYEVKFSTLRRVYGKYLVINVSFWEPLSDLILLSIVRSNDVDAVLGKLLDGHVCILFVQLKTLTEAPET